MQVSSTESLLAAASPDGQKERGNASLAVGHLLRHVEKQATIAFLYLPEKAAKTPKVTSILTGAAPGDIVGALPFRQVWQHGRFFPVVEELVERHFHRPRQFFKGFNRRHRMAVFDARDIASEQTG